MNRTSLHGNRSLYPPTESNSQTLPKPKKIPESEKEFLWLEWFGQVFICAPFEAFHSTGPIGSRREQDHRDEISLRIRLQASAQ
jgi:hypothetical protein